MLRFTHIDARLMNLRSPEAKDVSMVSREARISDVAKGRRIVNASRFPVGQKGNLVPANLS